MNEGRAESKNPLVQHWRNHAGVHLSWVIFCLVAIIVAFIIKMPNGNVLFDYISFASSVASLILAALAIAYAIFTNQTFSEHVGELRSSTVKMREAAGNLIDTSATIKSQSSQILEEISSLPPAVQEISNKLDNPARVSNERPIDTDSSLLKSSPPNGVKLALYAMARSCATQKPIIVDKFMSDNLTWQSWIVAVLTMVGLLKIDGAIVEHKFDEGKHQFYVKSLGKIDSIAIEQVINSAGEAFMKEHKRSVDLYFTPPQEGEGARSVE